jgi:acetyltransferase
VPNPVDVAGGTDADPSLFADCARIILQDPNVGGLLLVGLFGGYGIRFAESLAMKEEDAAHQMGKMVKKYNKPIVIHSLFASDKPPALVLCRYYDISVYDSLDVACKCIGALAEYGRYLKSYRTKVDFTLQWGAKAQPEGRDLISGALADGRQALLEPEAKRLLELHGAAASKDRVAATADEAAALAREMGLPVVLKIVSPDILHKSDAGGVMVGLKTEKQVRQAFAAILKNARRFDPRADLRGVLVSPMASAGTEVIIGTKIDDQFGPVIMFGLGGDHGGGAQGRGLPGLAHQPRHGPQDDRRDPGGGHSRRGARQPALRPEGPGQPAAAVL